MSSDPTSTTLTATGERTQSAPQRLDDDRPGAGDVGQNDRRVLLSTPGFYKRAWRSLRHDKVAMFSLTLCIVIIAFSFGAPLVAKVVGVDYRTQSLTNQFLEPFKTWDH